MFTLFIVVDAAIAVIAVRSLLILGARSPWTSAGWAATAVWGVVSAWRYAQPATQHVALIVSGVCFALLAVAFIVAGIRDEAQAEPLMWPVRVGLTRAQKRQ